MEGLRGFAVFLVFLVHFVTLAKPWISSSPHFLVFARSIHSIGNTGVDLFFVLSGYLIYGSLLSKRQEFLRFMSRRIERIYPAFLSVYTVYLALSFFFPAENKIPSPASEGIRYLIANLLLLPGLFPIEPMITVAWSLSYEMFYYLAIPLVVVLFKLRERSVVWRITFFLIVATLAVIYCAVNGGHVRLIMFISGIMLYETMNIRRAISTSAIFGFLALLIGLLSVLIPIDGTGGSALKATVLFVAFYIVCLVCFRNPTSWLPRTFSWTPLRWLGNMSYSYYLLHGLALKAGFIVLSKMLPSASYGPLLFWLLLPPMFVLTLIPSAALFLLVERPFSLTRREIKSKLT